MTIVVYAVVDVDPAQRGATLTGSKPHIDAALAQDGCLAYAWTADPHDPARVHVFEEWTGLEALASHLAGPAYRGMLGHMQGAGITSAISHKYAVSAKQPVYDSNGVPRADFF
ncbi:MAG: putative quinol monooxygenase [Polymorphobacter sp.]